MTPIIEQANEAYRSDFSHRLKGIGAVFCGRSSVLSRIEQVCPEFEIRKYEIENEFLYISDGCHLFSDAGSINRDEFVIGNFINEKMSIEIINLICFYHISMKSIKPGDIIEIGRIECLDSRFTHVVIFYPFFMPKEINKISKYGFIYNLSWILPICQKEFEFINHNGLGEFELKIHNSKYDFFDIRDDVSYLK